MRPRFLLALGVALIFTGCDSAEPGPDPCSFEMEFAGALEGSISGRALFSIDESDATPQRDYSLTVWLEPQSENDEVSFGPSESTCRIIGYGPYSLFASYVAGYVDEFPELGRYRTGESTAITDLGVVARLGTRSCQAEISPTSDGTLTLNHLTDGRLEGTFETPLRVAYASDTLTATMTSRFNAWVYDDNVAECYND